MTIAEAIDQFTEAATLDEHRNRSGNWEPISRSLRHFTAEGSATVEADGELNGDTVLRISPAEIEPPKGKSAAKRGPFLLLVRIRKH